MIENPLKAKLKDYSIILASGSPRRKAFFEEMGLSFEIRLKPVEENYPNGLKAGEIADFLAELKAEPFLNELEPNEILLTSDTVVWWNGQSLEKAKNRKEAEEMLIKLSGDWHEVITSVCIATKTNKTTAHAITQVKFKKLSFEEISHYIEKCQPYDKAGAYGIQEWIGAIAIEEINGSYNNVVGLPTHLVYKMLMDMVST